MLREKQPHRCLRGKGGAARVGGERLPPKGEKKGENGSLSVACCLRGDLRKEGGRSTSSDMRFEEKDKAKAACLKAIASREDIERGKKKKRGERDLAAHAP